MYRGEYRLRKRHTVKGVHERIASNGRACAAGRGGQWMMNACLVPAHDMFDGFVSREVDSVRRA